MRQPFIAGNWKMHLDRARAVALASRLAEQLGAGSPVRVAVCPPAVYLEAVAGCLRDSAIGLGGQNMHYENSGAYTGEVSGPMLKDIGCQYVILGHSERRQLFHETDELVHKKVMAALAAGLTPIVCVGESLEQREAGRTLDVIREQFAGGLGGLSAEQIQRVVIAYEPVWAIGTGRVASPEQAEAVHADLRQILETQYNAKAAEAVPIQYGGSVKPDNAAALLGQPNIDGALVGGASLEADSFLAIIAAASATRAA